MEENERGRRSGQTDKRRNGCMTEGGKIRMMK
jgi:hypothetical protein